MAGRVSRRALLVGATAALAAPAVARAATQPGLKLGCLTDLNGPYADLTGRGSIAAIKLAVEDFGRERPDVPVETVNADFGLKPDTGMAILRRWLDVDGVDAVLDFPMSALAIGATTVFQEKNKVGLITSAATSELTRGSCGPNHVQFASDTFALAASLVKNLVQGGGTSWFFVMPNYELGKSMVGDASRVVVEVGGSVVGTVADAFPGTSDLYSVLLQAQARAAQGFCVANAGDDLTNCLKQAREFDIGGAGRLLAVPFMGEPTIKALGLADAGGGYFPSPFYWDRDEGCRAFSARMAALLPDQRPNKNNANAYAGALHYLRVAAAMGTEAAKADGRAVVRKMKETPMHDTLFGSSAIRADGQALHDMLLLRIKTPAQSRERWDICSIESVLPAEQATRPLSLGECKMVHS